VKRHVIITIDGPAGSGKSSVAKMVAQRLGFAYLDSGAIYRAVAFTCCRRAYPPTMKRKLKKALKV